MGSRLLSPFLSVSHHHCQTLTTTTSSIYSSNHLCSLCRLTLPMILTPRSRSSVNAPSDPSVVLQIKTSTTAQQLQVVVVVVEEEEMQGHHLTVTSVQRLCPR